MHAPKLLVRAPSERIQRLRVFREQVLNHPSRDETVATWRWLEQRLPLEHQSRLLYAWNKRLLHGNATDDIAIVVDDIIQELRS